MNTNEYNGRSTMREVFARLRDWMRRDRLDAELKEELRFHQSRLERDSVSDNVGGDNAKHIARRQLGNTTSILESARELWSIPWMDHLQRDIRYALRGLRRSPGFTTTVVLTFALGIGANVAMFGVIDRRMFRVDPYLRDADHVHLVYLQTTNQNHTNTTIESPYARYLDFQKNTTSFSEIAAFSQRRHGVGTGADTQNRHVAVVSANFFNFFNARPALGRFIAASEDQIPKGENVVVLSYAFWATQFGKRNVVGEVLQVGRAQYTIIGVTPENFVGFSEGRAPSVYVPITSYAANEGVGQSNDYYMAYNWDWTEVVVRRKPGVSVEQASSDLTTAFTRSRAAARVVHPNFVQVERAGPRAILGSVRTGAGPDAGSVTQTLLWVEGVAFIVLFIACANVANLLLARALRRRRDTSLRIALGVSRSRLVIQSFTEALLLSVLGCIAGILVAQFGGALLQRLVDPMNPAFNIASDWRTLRIAIFGALGAGLLTGLAPVMLSARNDVIATLKSGARDGTNQRSTLRTFLLVTQAALSVALLVGAGFFVLSLSKAQSLVLGYDVAPLLITEWENRGVATDSAETFAIRERMLQHARSIPGVTHAAWTSNTPLHGTSTMGLAIPGIDSAPLLGRFNFQTAGDDYFETIGTHIVQGRAFTEQDHADAPHVAVVSVSMARILWPNKSALGQCMFVYLRRPREASEPCTTVVGVAQDAVHDPTVDQPLRYYVPDRQIGFASSMLLLRVSTDPDRAAESVRRSLQSVMPGLSFVMVRPFHELVDKNVLSWKLGATMFASFGILALVVAAIGLYGVITYTVAQRMHEVGVRIALGAQQSDVVKLVVSQGVRFAIAGVFIGSAFALSATHWIQPLLFHQSARDPTVFAVVGVVMLLVALVASTIPALRAAKADPNTALRSD